MIELVKITEEGASRASLYDDCTEAEYKAYMEAGFLRITETVTDSTEGADNPLFGIVSTYEPNDDKETCIEHQTYALSEWKIEAEIKALKRQLSDTDYKIIKCQEAELLGDDMPYDLTAIAKERAAWRRRINELQSYKQG